MQNLYKIVFADPTTGKAAIAQEVKGGICQAQKNGTVIIYRGKDPSYTEVTAIVPKGAILLVDGVVEAGSKIVLQAKEKDCPQTNLVEALTKPQIQKVLLAIVEQGLIIDKDYMLDKQANFIYGVLYNNKNDVPIDTLRQLNAVDLIHILDDNSNPTKADIQDAHKTFDHLNYLAEKTSTYELNYEQHQRYLWYSGRVTQSYS